LLAACQNRRALAVANKADLDGARALSIDSFRVFQTSALTGQGINELREEILHTISGQSGGEQESGFLTNVRHQRLVEESIAGLDAARQAVERKIPHEMIMLDLYGAL